MNPSATGPLSRAEFEDFVHFFSHELRNRLNAIGLEAADLAEQLGDASKAERLQTQVRECAAFLKAARARLAPDDPAAERAPLAAVMAELKPKP
jgi:signal transduction histidine kinase